MWTCGHADTVQITQVEVPGHMFINMDYIHNCVVMYKLCTVFVELCVEQNRHQLSLKK